MPAIKVRGKSMPDLFITNEEARVLLKVICREHGSIKALAHRLSISRCSISLMLSGTRPIGGAVASVLGLQSVRGFVKVKRAR